MNKYVGAFYKWVILSSVYCDGLFSKVKISKRWLHYVYL